MYFHTTDTFTMETIERAANAAATKGFRFRIDVDSQGNLRYKIGEGMWSVPFPSMPDPYRDNSEEQRPRAAFTTERITLKPQE